MSDGKWRETVGHGFGTARNAGQTRKHEVTNELTGRTGGYHVEHWDGSQDAVVIPEPVGVGVSIQGKERVK